MYFCSGFGSARVRRLGTFFAKIPPVSVNMNKTLPATLLFLLPMLASTQTLDLPSRQPVQASWEFRQAHTAEWLPTAIPASVHTALLKNGRIEDPFYRDNEEKLQWIEGEDWEFRCTFDASPDQLKRKHVELVLRGLDTYAHVYLNDSLVLETDNMFRTWQADVKALLKPTGNRLHVYFESPVKKVAMAWENLGYELPGGIRTMTRKAQFHFGWDWGPRFAGCGILKTPELLAWDDLLIEDVYMTTQSLSHETARLIAYYRYRSDFSGPVTLITRDGKRKAVENRQYYEGVHTDSVTIDVPDPKLWWCRGMGEPHLYDFGLEVKRGHKIIEKTAVRTGIRKVELITEKDEAGETFYFKLNGRPVFCKGANYIPQDIFQDRVTPEHYKSLIDDVAAANMNMLRVWGGGIYEDDLFYQLCDARGIMVWQDFMFACALYPTGGSFLKTTAREAMEQIERLRGHPSVALFCGNNENNEAWHHWGWQMNFTEDQRAKLWKDYKLLFNDLLPSLVGNYGAGIPYWESSPKYGRGNPKSTREGDSHYWGVWHDAEPFKTYDEKVPRFMSEFGFQSFPEWRTIQAFTLPEDRALDSKVMTVHQKHPRGNALIAEYMKRDYRTPRDFENFVYVSQLLQAEGMRTGIEAHRRNKPYCMGTLYWQLNDVWPVASWSGRDYYGRWKALHYFAREAFSPVAVLPMVDDGKLQVYAVSDLPGNIDAALQIRAFTLDGRELGNAEAKFQVNPDSSRMVWTGPLKSLLKKADAEEAVVELTLRDTAGQLLSRRLLYLVPPRELKLPSVQVRILAAEAVEDGYRLDLESSKLAKNVLLSTETDGFFSDNYFDLLPGERKSVYFRTGQALENPAAAFQVKSLIDSY
jgi:beta-mannosidase